MEIGSEDRRIETRKYRKGIADFRAKKSAKIEVKSAEIEVKQRKTRSLESKPKEKSYIKDAQVKVRSRRFLRNQELRAEEEEEYTGKHAKSMKKRAQGGGN